MEQLPEAVVEAAAGWRDQEGHQLVLGKRVGVNQRDQDQYPDERDLPRKEMIAVKCPVKIRNRTRYPSQTLITGGSQNAKVL